MLDKDIRALLLPELELHFNKVIQEKQIYDHGTVVADVVGICEDYMVGFEIKSDHDTFTRLANQIEKYSKAFDHNYLVTTDKYMNEGLEFIPKEWGLIWMHDNRIIEYRRAVKTPNDYFTVYNMFWSQEIKEKLKKDDIKGRSKCMFRLFDLVKETYKQDEIEVYLRTCLLSRKGWK